METEEYKKVVALREIYYCAETVAYVLVLQLEEHYNSQLTACGPALPKLEKRIDIAHFEA